MKKREKWYRYVYCLQLAVCQHFVCVCVCVHALKMFVSRVLSDTLLPLLCPVWSGGQAGAWRCAKGVQGRAVQFCQPPGAAAGSAADHHAPVWEVSRVLCATVISLGGILILACFLFPPPPPTSCFLHAFCHYSTSHFISFFFSLSLSPSVLWFFFLFL